MQQMPSVGLASADPRLPHPLVGRPPRNKGRHYPPDPPPVEEIIAVMRVAGTGPEAYRLRALVVLLWRAGLRISEALALTETDLDPGRGAVLVRCGKGGKGREVGLDPWGWEQLRPWSELRRRLPIGTLLCTIRVPAAGAPWEATAARKQLRRLALRAGIRRRFAPHQLRHAHAVEMAHEGVPMVVIQRQLGHANLGITSIYLQGIDSAEIINTVHARHAPVISATAGRALQHLGAGNRRAAARTPTDEQPAGFQLQAATVPEAWCGEGRLSPRCSRSSAYAEIASCMRVAASSRLAPSATTPGKSGRYAPQPPSSACS